MALYVLAFTDSPASTFTPVNPRLASVEYDGIHVVYERRAAAPPVGDVELRQQHAVVTAIAERTRAVLPARFGALVEKPDLTAFLRQHGAAIRAALDEVRDRVQMTVRVLGSDDAPRPAPRPPATSGRDYLERARRASTPALPSPAERLLSALRPYVAIERREPGAGRLLATIYHLVDAQQVAGYKKMSAKQIPGVMVTGPWPPFAFSPQLW